MIKRLLVLDGVQVVAQFRDDGSFVAGYGMMDEEQMLGLAQFAHGYKRLTQGNADQLSMFTQMNGWTPPKGWVVKGNQMSVCSFGNIVCLVKNDESNISEVISEMEELSRS